jgi:hypothetical protein
MACKNQDYAFQLNRDQLEDYTTHLRFMGEYFVKTSKVRNGGLITHRVAN